MPAFPSDGVRIHYELHGQDDGDPVILVHGFASHYHLNWVGSRWQETLVKAGRLVIGIDCRGHGQSEKPHDPAAYSRALMAEDVANLLGHLGISRSDYIGYSMGSWIGLLTLIRHPDLVGRAVLGGIGQLRTFSASQAIADRFRQGAREGAPTADQPAASPIVEAFWQFASSQPHNDLEALAACIEAPQKRPEPEELAGIRTPVLVAVGEEDAIAPHPEELVAMVPNARLAVIEGRNHFNITPSRAFKQAALEFLEET